MKGIMPRDFVTQSSRHTGLLAAILGILILLAACNSPAPGTNNPLANAQPTAAAPQPSQAADQVVADAVVVPVQEAKLSLPVAGTVKEVLVAEGDAVAAGDVLLRLEDAKLQAALAQAEAALHRAEAQRDQLKAGPRPAEVAAARLAVTAAEKQVERLKAGARQQEVAVASAGQSAAQAALQKVQEGPNVNERIAAQTEVDDAAARLRQAQAAYDRAAGNADIGARPEALQLEQATNAYNAARARLNALNSRVTAADIAQARARVQQAQAELALVQAPARPEDLAAAEVEVERAQAQLDLVEQGARPEAIAAAEADVAAAAAAVAQAKAALQDTLVVAPFAGQIASLDVQPGEFVAPGVPVAWLADTTRWQIETDDLTELDVVNVAPGAKASITFDALPDLELRGTVARIKPLGEDKLGDMTYTVVIQPDTQDNRLRWNMTATVTIE